MNALPSTQIVNLSPELLRRRCGLTSVVVGGIGTSNLPAWKCLGRYGPDQINQELQLTQCDGELRSLQPDAAVDLWGTGGTPADWGGGPADPPFIRAWIVVEMSRRVNAPTSEETGGWARQPAYLPGMPQVEPSSLTIVMPPSQQRLGQYLIAIPFPGGNANADATTQIRPFAKQFVPEVARVKYGESVGVFLVVHPVTANIWAVAGEDDEAHSFATIDLQFRKIDNGVEFTSVG